MMIIKTVISLNITFLTCKKKKKKENKDNNN